MGDDAFRRDEKAEGGGDIRFQISYGSSSTGAGMTHKPACWAGRTPMYYKRTNRDWALAGIIPVGRVNGTRVVGNNSSWIVTHAGLAKTFPFGESKRLMSNYLLRAGKEDPPASFG